tara:strand:- start:89202 stop:89432 length:231 start_codon:yes stop_codon:yes gene_type:complete
MRCGFGYQVILRRKMPVEGAMCQASCLHNLCDGDRLESLFTKQQRRLGKDSATIFGYLFTRNFTSADLISSSVLTY